MNQSQEEQEKEVLRLLKEDPQEAIVLAVQYYTGLVWTAAGQYLANPEDIKECVNDTFAEFYRHRERFDETKGSLAAFLSTIARHQAISLYRRCSRQEVVSLDVEPGDDQAEMDLADDRLDLERAIRALGTEDAEIIRMKYYGGMTVREIADSLAIPYETVKKRHQRSLGKLRLLLLSILLLILAAGLAACAMKILQYFGVIPGYGINRSDKMNFYVLDGPVALEEEQFLLRLEGCVLSEDSLILTLYEEFPDAWFTSHGLERGVNEKVFTAMDKTLDLSAPTVTLEDGTVYSNLRLTSGSALNKDNSIRQIQIIFEPAERFSAQAHSLSATLRLSDREISFVLRAAREETLEDYSYELEEQGGLLAIPMLAEGHLYVDIYPLNCGEYKTDPGLVRSVEETAGGPKGQVTATGPDGSVHIGTCVSYTPFSTNAFFRWDFGPAEPGEYLLNVPYVYQTAQLPEDLSFTVSDANPGIGQCLKIPGSILTIVSYSPEQPAGTDFQRDGDQENEVLRRFLCFNVETTDSDRVLAWLRLRMDVETEADGQVHYASHSSLWQVRDGYLNNLGYAMLLPEGYEEGPVTFCCVPHEWNTVTYRWNHEFSIPIHVGEEE